MAQESLKIKKIVNGKEVIVSTNALTLDFKMLNVSDTPSANRDVTTVEYVAGLISGEVSDRDDAIAAAIAAAVTNKLGVAEGIATLDASGKFNLRNFL